VHASADGTDGALQKLRAHVGIIEFKSGAVIYSEGEEASGVYCVHEGTVAVTKRGVDGTERLIRIARTGDLLGIPNALIGGHHDVSAAAHDDAVVCFIPRYTLHTLSTQASSLMTIAMQQICRQIDSLEREFAI
jgi:CRP-like cAMP-binding protein